MFKTKLLNTTFICPYMKIRLEAACMLYTCPYHTFNVESHCIWEYTSSKKSISTTELSIILNKNKKTIENILQNAKFKIINTVIKRKLITTPLKLHYCYQCGKAYDLKQVNNHYICRDECKRYKPPIIKHIEREYQKPISHILIVLSTLIKLSVIAKLLKTTNKTIKNLYISIFGDSSLIYRVKDIKNTSFKKRNKRLDINVLGKRSKTLSFSRVENKIFNFFKEGKLMAKLTLEQAAQSGKIYVINKSKPKGDILISFIQPGSGKSFVATIPKTWIPIAVSEAVPMQVILESVDFRSYLQSKMIELIPASEAEAILSTEDAKEELARIYTSKFSDEETKIKNDDEDSDDEKKIDVQSFIKDENLLVKDILERNDGGKTSVILNELRSVEEELTKEDLVYVIKNTAGKVRSWAEKKLNQLTK